MASAAKRLRVHNYYYQAVWENEYFVVPIGGRCRCLVCGYVFGANRKYIVQRHFKTYHANLDADFPKGSPARKRAIRNFQLELAKMAPLDPTDEMAETVTESTGYQRKSSQDQSLRQAEEIGLVGSRRVWTHQEIAILLGEYRKHGCLYDMKNVNYRNKFARQEALDDVAKVLCKIRPQTSGVDVKLKFNTLRTQYHAELSKEKKNVEGGKPYVTTLWFMDHMKFVGDQDNREIYGQGETDNLNSKNSEVRYEDPASLSEDYSIETDGKYIDYETMDTENSEDPLSNTEKPDISFVIKTEDLGIEEVDLGSETTSYDKDEEEEDRSNSPMISPATSTLLNQKQRGEKVQVSESHSMTIKRPNSDMVGENSVQNSEEDLFGQIVAKKLKKITNPRKRANVEFKIFSILHSAVVEELG